MPNEFKVKNGLLVSGSANINASGSEVFSVDGTSGRLFQIDDSLSGSLFSVNTAAGLPLIEAFSDNTVRIGRFGQTNLFVSQSRVGIGKESNLNSILDIFGSASITGSFSITGSVFSPSVTSIMGSLGIGIASPTTPLHVAGQLRLSSYTTTTSFSGTPVGVLAFDSSGNILTIATPGGGGGGTPGGANTNIQFNSGGSFGGSNNFSFITATNTVSLTGSLVISGSVTSSSDILVNGMTIGRGSGIGNNIIIGSGSFINAGISSIENIAIGNSALASATNGSTASVAIGTWALSSSNAPYSTAVGAYAASFSKTVQNVGRNNAFGYGSLYFNENGECNTAMGSYSLFRSQGFYNAALGDFALFNLSSGADNTGIGQACAPNFQTGSGNVFVGRGAAPSLLSGSNNTIIGAITPSANINNPIFGLLTGSNNTILGSNVFGLPSVLNNNIILSDGEGNIRYRWNGTANVFTGSFIVTGSGGNLFSIVDSGTNFPTIATFSSGSRDVLTITTSSVLVTGSVNVIGTVSASSYLGSGASLTGIVTQIVAGTNVTISPVGGTGVVTINSSGGGGGTPGGANTNIQFNNAGAFGGSNNFTFVNATNTVQIQGSGSVLLRISGSRGDLLRVVDSGSSSPVIATISSGSRNVFTFTTSSLDVSGSVDANIVTNQLLYGRIVVTPAANQDNYSPTGWNDADPSKATTININAASSIKITGLAGGLPGRVAVLKNSSPDRLIILEDSSSASTATNRFDFRNSIFLLPNGSATLLYDGVDNVWQPIGTSGGIGFDAFFDVYDDFLGAAGSFTTTAGEIGRFGGIGLGSGASGQVISGQYLINTTEKPLGVVQIDTGTTSTGTATLGSYLGDTVIPANGQAMFLCRIAVDNLSTGTDEYQIFAGFHDAVSTTNVTDGVYWVYNRVASTAWQGATANNGTRTTTGVAGPTVDTNYIWLGIYVNPSWTRATYFYSTDSITWIISGEQTTNLPPQTRSTGFGVTINKTVGTGQRNCYLDLLAYRYDITRG